MGIELEGRENIKSRNKLRLVLSILILVLVFAAALLSQLGMLVFPFLAGALAALFVVDNGERRLLSISISAIAVAVDFAFNLYVSFTALGAVIVALLIARWFNRRGSKGLCVGISTVFVSLLLVAYVFLAAFYELGSFDFSAAAAYVKDTVALTRESLYDTMSSLVSIDAVGEQTPLFSDAVINDAIDYYLALLPSMVVIIAFALVGIASKTFTFIVDRILSGGELGISSSFRTPAAFAYFYVILSIFSMLESDGSAFNVAMLNLHAIFLAVYAYVGFRFLTYILARRMKSPILAWVIVILLTLMLSGFSLQILSVVGVFETIAVARLEARSSNENNDAGG